MTVNIANIFSNSTSSLSSVEFNFDHYLSSSEMESASEAQD
jgi:hypothetical protein